MQDRALDLVYAGISVEDSKVPGRGIHGRNDMCRSSCEELVPPWRSRAVLESEARQEDSIDEPFH